VLVHKAGSAGSELHQTSIVDFADIVKGQEFDPFIGIRICGAGLVIG
jgi:hypothetical protein